jgi:hypothetical protein
MNLPIDRPTGLRPADRTVVLCLTCVAAIASLLSSGAAGVAWLPAWTGAAIAFAALLGMLLTLRRAGALRMRFLVLFVAALAAAALYGWLSAPHG